MVTDSQRSHSSCARCGKNSLITDDDNGEQVCQNCGFVVTEKSQNPGPEWRSFQRDADGNSARTGVPLSLTRHDKGLATVIGSVNRDSTGKPLSSSMKSTIERLRTWDNRSQAHTSEDRNLRQALNELGKLKEKLALPSSVAEKAAYIYRKSLEKKLTKGRSISALLAASLYVACRDAEAPRTISDVSAAANVKRKDITKCYRLLHIELDLKMPVVDPIQCIARISSKLDISEKAKRDAIKILHTVKEHYESSGKAPMGLAATALYMSCVVNNLSVTQRDMADAAGVTEVTIRNRYKGIKRNLGLDQIKPS